MADTFTTDNYGVTKLKAANFAKGDGVSPGTVSSGHEAAGVGGLPGGDLKSQVSSPPGIDPAHLNALKEAAANGDPEAGHLLQVLGAMGAGGLAMTMARKFMGKGSAAVDELSGNLPASSPGFTTDGPGPKSPHPGYTKPTGPKVTQLKDEQIIPRGGPQRLLPGPAGLQLETGAPARIDTTATAPRYLQARPTNPRNVPVTSQGSTDAAYSIKAAQDAAAAKAVEGANPGRAAARLRMDEMAQALRRVVR